LEELRMRLAVAIVFGLIVVGCSHSGIPAVIPNPGSVASDANRGHAGAIFKVLYRFKGGPDAEDPQGFLVPVRGKLYGASAGGEGTIFAVTTSGQEHVVYAFTSTNGMPGYGALLSLGGKLYGTCDAGGSYYYGTLFQLSTAGGLTVLANFQADQGVPNAGLLQFNGNLYGTTAAGGLNCQGGCGTVFKLGPFGLKTIYQFKGYPHDGQTPFGSLTAVNGTFYGTTRFGGSGYGCDISGDGCGTIFSVTTSGKERIIYNFKGGPRDGAYPEGKLLNVRATLYGVTPNGGNANCSGGCGTVFAITPVGKERVVYQFAGGSDGAYPSGGLVELNGVLYGVTSAGGAQCPPSGRCGTVFSLTTSGKKSIVYDFKGGRDGQDPQGALVILNGKLYGTTSGGGVPCYGSTGCGTVFQITP
jgi:uncharacterized repeat protein (TIGR03803 family)